MQTQGLAGQGQVQLGRGGPQGRRRHSVQHRGARTYGMPMEAAASSSTRVRAPERSESGM